jgi:hypothetical protein
MNEIEWLVQKLHERFPEATTHVDEPEKPKGSHWLDVRNGQKIVTVEWRPELGFGFYSTDAGYGEGPEEIITEKERVLGKVISLLQA